MKNKQNYPLHDPMKLTGSFTKKIRLSDFEKSDGTRNIILQIFIDGERLKHNLNISVADDYFDLRKQRVRGNHKFAKDYNLIIEQTFAKINDIEVNYRLQGKKMTMIDFKNEFFDATKNIDFIKFWQEEMKIQEKILKKGTYKQQISVLKKVKSFKNPLFFSSITEKYLSELTAYLKHDLQNQKNTIATTLKSIKKYLHIAEKQGFTTPLKWNDIKNRQSRGDRTFLTESELNRLNDFYNSTFINITQKNILQRFLFSCFTGLRISDILKLKRENFIENTLVFSMEKTGILTRIPLNESSKRFLTKNIFEGSYTEQHINRELKEIMKVCGITKKVTFHVARHTFATQFLLNNGNVVKLQQLLGHSEINTTMIYVHITNELLNDQVFNLDAILHN